MTDRLVLGILVVGKESNPVTCATSNYPHAPTNQGVTEDVGIDTNFGVLSRLTWDGSEWDKLDLVPGLPQSEQLHMVHGLQLDPVTNTLYIAQGGTTNSGRLRGDLLSYPSMHCLPQSSRLTWTS